MTTQERLKELFDYNPMTGDFVRKVSRSGPKAHVGSVAGCDNGQGYIRIYVDGKPYKAHRLAWLYVHGSMPKEIDHKNLNRSDNRIANLRAVSRGQNRTNCGAYKNNTSGLKGVSLYKPNGKWKAQIQKDGKKLALGYFDTKEEAHSAYVNAASRMFGEFARSA